VTRMARRTAVTAGLVLAVGASAATAGWQAAVSASMPITTATLTAATSPSATASCLTLIPRVTVSWTPTASPADGYRIYRRTGAGAFSLRATVSGRTTSAYVDAPLATSTTYGYYVQAYVGSWTADTTIVSATTAAVCLI
jgi:hypothetical protein